MILIFLGTAMSCAVRRGTVHTVKEGQTLWRISRAYNVDLDVLIDVNDIENARSIKPGTKLVIPGASETVELPDQKRGDDRKKTRVSASRTSKSEPNNDSSEARISPGTETQSDQKKKKTEKKSSDKTPSFQPVWPCKGRLASQFDSNGDPTRQGIRIHTKTGAEVRAADDGNVKLAGTWEKLPQLGKIVILFHNNDIATVYAHLQSVSVSEGDRVKRAQTIGRAGKSGETNRSVCYFEVRYKLEPRDPLIFLGEKNDKID